MRYGMRYDYKCINCGSVFEIEKKSIDQQMCECPECHCTASHFRYFGEPATVIFKGNGWTYKTKRGK